MLDDITDDLEFERQLAEMRGRDLLLFTARQVYQANKRNLLHEARLAALEKERRLGPRVVAAIGGAVGGVVAGLTFGIIKLADKS
jgi:hypothetical protein